MDRSGQQKKLLDHDLRLQSKIGYIDNWNMFIPINKYFT